MPITRAQAETVLVRRAGPLLDQAGLDSSTHDGTNQDLADPIARAVRALGHATADPADPTDADLAAVVDSELDELLDVAEVRVLETVHAALLNLVTVTAGPRKEEYSHTARGLEAKIARLARRLCVSPLEGGTLPLDIAEHGPGAEGL